MTKREVIFRSSRQPTFSPVLGDSTVDEFDEIYNEQPRDEHEIRQEERKNLDNHLHNTRNDVFSFTQLSHSSVPSRSVGFASALGTHEKLKLDISNDNDTAQKQISSTRRTDPNVHLRSIARSLQLDLSTSQASTDPEVSILHRIRGNNASVMNDVVNFSEDSSLSSF